MAIAVPGKSARRRCEMRFSHAAKEDHKQDHASCENDAHENHAHCHGEDHSIKDGH